MESGGVREPEAVNAVEADWTYDTIGLAIAPLENLREDALLAIVGAYSLTPEEQRSAVILAWAPKEIKVELLKEGLVVDTTPVDLVVRGRKTIRRILTDWEEELREKVCPLRARKEGRRAERIAEVAAILANILSVGAAVVAAIAVLLVKFYLDELCEGWPAPRPVAPLSLS